MIRPRLLKSCATLMALLCSVAALSSCQSLLPYRMGGNPAQLRPGATSLEVLAEMGSPTQRKMHVNGETWIYADYWWTKEVWKPHWATWEVYMEGRPGHAGILQFRGWKLIDPPWQETNVRSVVYPKRRTLVAVPAPTPPRPPTEKVIVQTK